MTTPVARLGLPSAESLEEEDRSEIAGWPWLYGGRAPEDGRAVRRSLEAPCTGLDRCLEQILCQDASRMAVRRSNRQ